MREEGTPIVKNGITYWRVRAVWYDEFNRKRTKGFERKKLIDAINARNVWLKAHGKVQESEPCGTLKQLFAYVEPAIWAHAGEQHQRSMKLYRGQWEAALGDVSVDALTSPILTRTLAALTAGKRSKSTINKCTICIRQALAYAVSDLGWIEANPADAIRRPKIEKTGRAYPPMTPEEYDRMVALAEPAFKVLIRLQGECGMRPIEAGKVRPSHLFSVRDHWMVNIPDSKTEAGHRCIPISDELSRLIEEHARNGWKEIKDPADGLRKWWRENSETRMYDLRGWCADQWRRRGVPEQIRHVLLGHSEMKFSQRVYETLTSEDVLAMFGR